MGLILSILSKLILKGHLDVYMLDIGQGDAILLKVGDEYSMIDTGDIEHREKYCSSAKNLWVLQS